MIPMMIKPLRLIGFLELAVAGCLIAATDANAASPAVIDDFDPSLCRILPNHRPAPDVEYVPGVDVRGNRVAPADLPGSNNAVPGMGEKFEIPITLNMARRLGFANVRTGLPGSTEVGRLQVDGNRVLFNGQQIGGGAAGELSRYCRNR